MDTDYKILPASDGSPARVLWNASHDANVPWAHWKSQVDELCAGADDALEIQLVGRNGHRPAEWARWFERCAPLFAHFHEIRWTFDDSGLEKLFRSAGCDLLKSTPA